MSKTVTLRLNQNIYELFRTMAESDNRTLSNFIETSALRYIEEHEYVDDYEMEEIRENQQLNRSLKRGLKDMKSQKGNLISLHTWGGNLKAMPLYKRQGYKWRPDTSVYMENYIPQILNFDYFRKFFSEVTSSWYDCFKPVITQEPDNESLGEMFHYEYFFEEGKNSLRVWIDRTIGRINGFHLITDDIDVKIRAKTPNSKAFIGFEEFPLLLSIQNNSSKDKHVEITISPSKQIRIIQDLNSTSFTIFTIPCGKKTWKSFSTKTSAEGTSKPILFIIHLSKVLFKFYDKVFIYPSFTVFRPKRSREPLYIMPTNLF